MLQFIGSLEILVSLTNDNVPIRAVDKVFHVVTNGERLLTGANLLYADADIDCTPQDIAYTYKDFSDGGIFSALNPSVPLFQFTQVLYFYTTVMYLNTLQCYSAGVSVIKVKDI